MEDWGSVGAWERVFDSPSRLLTFSLSSTVSQSDRKSKQSVVGFQWRSAFRSFSSLSTHHEIRNTFSDDHSRHVGVGADAVGHD